jgi:hypothetical protein
MYSPTAYCRPNHQIRHLKLHWLYLLHRFNHHILVSLCPPSCPAESRQYNHPHFVHHSTNHQPVVPNLKYSPKKKWQYCYCFGLWLFYCSSLPLSRHRGESSSYQQNSYIYLFLCDGSYSYCIKQIFTCDLPLTTWWIFLFSYQTDIQMQLHFLLYGGSSSYCILSSKHLHATSSLTVWWILLLSSCTMIDPFAKRTYHKLLFNSSRWPSTTWIWFFRIVFVLV